MLQKHQHNTATNLEIKGLYIKRYINHLLTLLYFMASRLRQDLFGSWAWNALPTSKSKLTCHLQEKNKTPF